jgi:hypothetical protein
VEIFLSAIGVYSESKKILPLPLDGEERLHFPAWRAGYNPDLPASRRVRRGQSPHKVLGEAPRGRPFFKRGDERVGQPAHSVRGQSQHCFWGAQRPVPFKHENSINVLRTTSRRVFSPAR